MNESIILPTPNEIAERIRACREELAALRRLQRLAQSAQTAAKARERRDVAKGGPLLPIDTAEPLLIPDTAAAALAGISRARLAPPARRGETASVDPSREVGPLGAGPT